ncbi:hypothetical protein L7F22_021088 [Adiantum nelumboides]|nr:hypothetical protein [Adiantum nelumboides]
MEVVLIEGGSQNAPVILDADPKEILNVNKSVLDIIQSMPIQSNLYVALKQVTEIVKVCELPTHYDGYIAFELPLVDQPNGVVRFRRCSGHLKCVNVDCPYYMRSRLFNEAQWHGRLSKSSPCGQYGTGGKGPLAFDFEWRKGGVEEQKGIALEEREVAKDKGATRINVVDITTIDVNKSKPNLQKPSRKHEGALDQGTKAAVEQSATMVESVDPSKARVYDYSSEGVIDVKDADKAKDQEKGNMVDNVIERNVEVFDDSSEGGTAEKDVDKGEHHPREGD